MTYSNNLVDALISLFEHSPDYVVVADQDGAVVYLNPACLGAIGLDRSLGMEAWSGSGLVRADQIVGPARGDDNQAHQHERDMATALTTADTWAGEAVLLHTVTKERIPVSTSAFVVRGTAPDRPLVAAVHRDLRHRRMHDERLQNALVASTFRVAEQRMVADLSQLALGGHIDDLLSAAADAAMTLMNSSSALITRMHTAPLTLETVARSGASFPTGSSAPGDNSLPAYAMDTNSTVVCTSPGTETRFDASALIAYGIGNAISIPIAGAGRPWGALTVFGADEARMTPSDVPMLGTISDVLSAAIRRVDLESELRYRSLRDPLTGLPNRALAYDRIDEALERGAARSTRTAVMLIDLDDFKSINDSLGHEAGDSALVGLSSRLMRAARPGDTVARLGGDEFIAICENVDDVDHCRTLAQKFAVAVRSPIMLDSNELRITASIGIAIADIDTTGPELIRRADVAMYRAKDGGADTTAVFDTDDKDQARRQLAMSTDLRGALDHDGLTLEYQPIFDIETGAITAVEALARWTHPTLGEISPAMFVPVAERTGLINSLGLWALRTACEQAAQWQKISDIKMRVNVSALQLRQPNFVAQVTDVLAATKLPVGKLGIEITETVWLADTAQVRRTLTELHAMGVSILLDDLGSGHSSVTYLNRYPVIEAFKIDQTYIQAMPGRRPEAIVSAIVSLAHAFDVSVVGEGVETQTQLDRLRESGCDLAQGFLLATPASASEVTSMLLARAAG